jgi:hypothetical protein
LPNGTAIAEPLHSVQDSVVDNRAVLYPMVQLWARVLDLCSFQLVEE